VDWRGTEEPAQMHAGIVRLHDAFTEANIKHVFYESPGTSHEWQTWRRDLNDFAPRLFRPGANTPWPHGSATGQTRVSNSDSVKSDRHRTTAGEVKLCGRLSVSYAPPRGSI